MKKKLISLLLVLTFLLTLICGCSKKKKNNDLKTITLNEVAHSIFYAPQYVAIENGYFKEEGLELKLVNGAGADNVMTALVSGNADIGFMGSESSVYIYNEGAADYAVNFAQLTQRAGNFLVGRKSVDNFKWSDLKGCTILGGRKGGMPQMVFEYILKQNNIDPFKDLDIVQNIDFGLTAGSFATGTGDYTVEFEPFATTLEAEGKGVVIASLGEDSGYVPYTAYCVRQSYLKSHPDIVQSFTNAIQKGLEYVNTHTSEEIAKVIKPQFKETDIESIAKIVERYKAQDTWKTDTVFEEDSYNLLINILKSSGVIETAPAYNKIITTVYSEKAKK